MENKKKLFYIDCYNQEDKRSWSGTPYNLVKQLKRFYDVDVVWVKDPLLWKAFGFANKVVYKLMGKNYAREFHVNYAKMKGRQVAKALKGKSYDVAFFRGSPLAAYAQTDIKTRVYFSDACFHQMVDYYIYDASEANINEGNEIQRRAMEQCNVNVFTSNWALRDAVDFYHIPEHTCHIALLGASVDTKNIKKKERHDGKTVNLLFVGVDWERKGGEIAVECTKILNKKDPARRYILHLVGCKPPYKIADDNIIVYGFLNRNIPEHTRTMINLREQADLFVLPTKAECAGIVFCEASAYGIPSITFDTGGIGDYVLNGENGYRLPMGSGADDFANKILDVFSDADRLEYMKQKASEMYRERMNWDALGDKLNELIQIGR